MSNHPSEITPSFTTERLQIVANEIVSVRRDARLEHRPDKGDTGWGYGCRCYERACFSLEELVAFHAWLRVSRAHLACTIFIEDEPVKFYRGDPARPSERSLKGAVEEALIQHRLFSEDVLNPSPIAQFWLMVIVQETVDADPQIAMLQADREGHVTEPWFIPVDEPVAVVTASSALAREGIELEPPVVRPRGEPSKEKNGDGGDGNEDGSS